MKKISTVSILFLAVCAFCIILMRSCGGSDAPTIPSPTAATVIVEPTVEPVNETPTPTVVLTTPEPAEISLWATADLNLRRTPDTSAEVLVVIPKDAKLQRLDFPTGGWCKVKYESYEGYVSVDYVSKTDPAEAANAPVITDSETPISSESEQQESGFAVTPCSDTVYATDGINLRRGPGKEYDVAVSVNKNTALQRTGTTDNGWSRVLFESVGYFVSNDFVTATVPAELQESGESEESSPVINAGSVASEGEFKTDTGVALNLLVRWNTVPNSNGSFNLNISAFLISGPLTAAQYADNLCIKVGNDTFNKTAPAIEITENTLTETPLGSQTVVVQSGSVPVTVSWSFKGTYSGQSIDKLTASQTLVLR